jgi:hypothetical protein
MKRFKDNNSQKIVTAQVRAWINRVRSIKPPASLGTVPIRGMGTVDVPKVPPIAENWEEISKIMAGVKQADELQAIQNAKVGLAASPAIFLVNTFTKMPGLAKTSLHYLAIQLAAGELLALAIANLKPGQRALYMKAGGGIYDKISKIFETKYPISVYELKKNTSSFGSATPQYVFEHDELMTLKQIAAYLKNSPQPHPKGEGVWTSDKYLFHFKNQDDVDEINHMIEQILKDERQDKNLSKWLPVLGPAATGAVSLAYKSGSDWRKKNPTPQGKSESLTIITTDQKRKKSAREEMMKMIGSPDTYTESNTTYRPSKRRR